jgi:hypothetical protein
MPCVTSVSIPSDRAKKLLLCAFFVVSIMLNHFYVGVLRSSCILFQRSLHSMFNFSTVLYRLYDCMPFVCYI